MYGRDKVVRATPLPSLLDRTERERRRRRVGGLDYAGAKLIWEEVLAG